jgi:hypothetical protein
MISAEPQFMIEAQMPPAIAIDFVIAVFRCRARLAFSIPHP